MTDAIEIINPKRQFSKPTGRDNWFSYYAGFSGAFARQIVRSSGLRPGALIMDPWNGSGTTTAAAAVHGYPSVGFDLNPVMAVAAKARLLPRTEFPSVEPLLANIVSKARRLKQHCRADEPLLAWFMPDTVSGIRSIDRAIRALLVSHPTTSTVDAASQLSAIAAFYYVALFRSVRFLLTEFKRSNPTWIGRPVDPRFRVRRAFSSLSSIFAKVVREMLSDARSEPDDWDFVSADCTISVASSDGLPVRDKSVDFVLCSPPYCTRIDYGVATSPELAVLGFCLSSQLPSLRRQLIGTPTIQDVVPRVDSSWGSTCNLLLNRLYHHPSKAARSYYYKTYVQYFAGIARSFAELSRCMKGGAACLMVIQDSYFKNLRVDLASIFGEIGCVNGLTLSRQVDFNISRTFASINTRARRYRNERSATESILCFTRN